MAYKIVKLNKARCKVCGDVLISKYEGKEETCSCGKLKIGGGNSWLKRSGKSGVDFEELAILNFSQVPDNVIGTVDDDINQQNQTEG